MFFFAGLVFATWASRIPAIRGSLGLTDAQLAIAFAALNAAAIAGLQLASPLVTRIGSKWALQVSMPVFATALVGLSFADSLSVLCVIVGSMAASNSVIDVAINVQAVAVQQRLGRPVLSRFHAMHSMGMVVGAGAGALASAYDVAPRVHFGVVGSIVALLGTSFSSQLLAERSPRVEELVGTQRASWWTWPRSIVVIGSLGFCATFAEGAGNDWTTVYLHDEVGLRPSVAALGFAAFSAALVVGRLLGDGLVSALGATNAFRAGTLTGGLGFGASLFSPTPAVAFVGIAALGLGVSFLLPITLGEAAAHPGRSASASAVAQTSTLSYLGAFIGPGIIGPLADACSLRAALGVPAVLVTVAFLGARKFH